MIKLLNVLPRFSGAHGRNLGLRDSESFGKVFLTLRARSNLSHGILGQERSGMPLSRYLSSVNNPVSVIFSRGADGQVVGVNAPMVAAQVPRVHTLGYPSPAGQIDSDYMHAGTPALVGHGAVPSPVGTKVVHNAFRNALGEAVCNGGLQPGDQRIDLLTASQRIAVSVLAVVVALTHPFLVNAGNAARQRALKFRFLRFMRAVIAGAAHPFGQVGAIAVNQFAGSSHRGTPLGSVGGV